MDRREWNLITQWQESCVCVEGVPVPDSNLNGWSDMKARVNTLMERWNGRDGRGGYDNGVFMHGLLGIGYSDYLDEAIILLRRMNRIIVWMTIPYLYVINSLSSNQIPLSIIAHSCFVNYQ